MQLALITSVAELLARGVVVDIDVREASDVSRPAIPPCQMAQHLDDSGGAGALRRGIWPKQPG